MILEVAVLNVVPSQEFAFEAAFRRAVPILTGARGYMTHELRRSRVWHTLRKYSTEKAP